MADPALDRAIEAMRIRHAELRAKFIADMDAATGYDGSGELIADSVLAQAEIEFRRRFDALKRKVYGDQ
jgi:hypothetical protein